MDIEQISLLGIAFFLAQTLFKLTEKLPIFQNGKKNDGLAQAIDRLEKTIGNHHAAEIVVLEKIGAAIQAQSGGMIIHNTQATERGEVVTATLRRIEEKAGRS